MIVGIEGAIGSGKTILAVRYLYKDRYDFDNKVMANFKLKFDAAPLDILDILKMADEKININNVSVAIDEITVFMDCRRSASKMNLLLSYFILQTRKRNVNMYYTTQDFSMVDIRLYKHTDIMVLCDFCYNENVALDDWRHYTIFDLTNRRNPKISRFDLDISKYYDLYDTNEVILPPF